ncbi:hypothetical protein BGC_23150 [Burkholderia sp. 3C]
MLGIAVLTVPPTIFGFSWQGPLLSLLVKFNTIMAFAGIALLVGAALKWVPKLRNNGRTHQVARHAVNGVSALALNAAALLFGLSFVIAWTHDGHALSVMLIGAIWFVALRHYVLEQASGAPRMAVVSACAGWMAGVSFQSDIAHIVASAMHHV